MIGKVCRAPAAGGTARGNVRYILGYALGSKDGAEEQRVSHAAMMAEAGARADYGAGVVWSPTAGERRRPSSVYAANVTSLATADLEIEATASANPRVRESTMHLVFSLREGVERDDVEFIAGVRETLDRVGLGHHQYVIAVHRDTDALHAHVALGTVDPLSYRAMDRQWLWERLDRAMRETEIERGWEHDHGLVVVRDAGLPTQRIEPSTRAERTMWSEARARERLDRLERRRYQTYEDVERDFGRYADSVLGPRLRQTCDSMREVGENPTWTELHRRAAEYGAKIRLREGADPAALPSYDLVEIRRDEDGQRIEGGAVVPLVSVVRDDFADVGPFRSLEEAERDFAASVDADVSLIARRLSRERSTFDRDDIVSYLDARLSDPEAVERIADRFIREDTTLRVVSADTKTPLFSTHALVDVEERLAEHARALAARNVESFDRRLLERAVSDVERDLTRESGKPARLSDEQRGIVSHLDRGLVCAEGDPGTGKTVSMRVAVRYAELTGREIVGLTTSQAAANRLRDETGMTCWNTSKGEILERLGEKVIPNRGIVVLDEAAMNDSATAERLLAICRERGSQAVLIGDTKQLQPILAGQSLRIVRAEAREAGTYETLVGIQRQRNDWHRASVVDLADALRVVETDGRIDSAKVVAAVERLAEHDVFEQHDGLASMIGAAARDYCADRAAGVGGVYLAAGNETRRYANEAIRDRLGLTGKGRDYVTRYGTREFAVGDTVVLRENDARLGLVNGDQAEVAKIKADRLHLRMADGKPVVVNTRRYDAVDHGYVISYHASQGASVEKSVLLLDKAASAELFFVGASRSKGSLRVHYSRGSFEDVHEIGEYVASRSTLKTTSRTFEELIGRGGGSLPLDEDHPLRPAYERAEREKRERREIAMTALHERCAERRAELPRDASLEDRLRHAKTVEREQRREAAAIVKEHAPIAFGRYVRDEMQRIAYERAREESRVRSSERDMRRLAEPSRTIERAHAQSEANRERNRGHEYSR